MSRSSFGPMVDLPSWWEPVTVPVWLPDASADTSLRDAIAGHIAVQGSPPRRSELTHNSLVYFADWRAANPLEPLERALAAMTRKKVSLVSIVVLPAGAFDRPRREVEAKLAPVAERISVQLLLTEDHEGGWTRTFAASRTPSAYVVNARRQFVWKHEARVRTPRCWRPLWISISCRLPRRAPARCAWRSRPAIGPRTSRSRMIGASALRSTGSAGARSGSLSGSPGPRPASRSFAASTSAGTGRQARAAVVAFHGGKERDVLETIRGTMVCPSRWCRIPISALRACMAYVAGRPRSRSTRTGWSRMSSLDCRPSAGTLHRSIAVDRSEPRGFDSGRLLQRPSGGTARCRRWRSPLVAYDQSSIGGS